VYRCGRVAGTSAPNRHRSDSHPLIAPIHYFFKVEDKGRVLSCRGVAIQIQNGDCGAGASDDRGGDGGGFVGIEPGITEIYSKSTVCINGAEIVANDYVKARAHLVVIKGQGATLSCEI